MTRKSRRELERAIDNLADGSESLDGEMIVFECPETGDWYADADMDGAPLDKDDVGPVMVVVEEVVATDWEADQ